MSENKTVQQEATFHWCKKWNQEPTDFVFGVMCFENPKPKNCRECQYFALKHVVVNFYDCPKTAIECLTKGCTYASANDSIFECTKPKGSTGSTITETWTNANQEKVEK